MSAERDEAILRRQLFAQLVAAQEEERLRIASEIHDDAVQALTAAGLRAQQLRMHLTDPAHLELMTKLENNLRESALRLRRLMVDLRAPSLEHAGLASAMRQLLDRLHQEMAVTFTLEDHLETEPVGGVRTALYRFSQEALTNLLKHSQATSVRVELRTADSGWLVRIQDDGRCFDTWQVDSPPAHVRLLSMGDRVHLGGGWLNAAAGPACGTLVELWLPAETETQDAAHPIEAREHA